MGATVRRVVATVLGVLTACGYTSEYVPPADWRVRPVYHGNDVEVLGPAGPPVCPDEVRSQPPAGQPPVMLIDEHGSWTRSTTIHVGALPHPHFVHPVGHPHGGHHGAVVTGWSGSGGGGDEAVAILLALAILASSGVAIGLAADPAEKSKFVAAGIDIVNQRNDQIRRKLTECATRLPPAGGAAP
jgi:hypothetical protein